MIKEKAIIKFKSKGLILHKRDGSRKKEGEDLFPKKKWCVKWAKILVTSLFDFVMKLSTMGFVI